MLLSPHGGLRIENETIFHQVVATFWKLQCHWLPSRCQILFGCWREILEACSYRRQLAIRVIEHKNPVVISPRTWRHEIHLFGFLEATNQLQ